MYESITEKTMTELFPDYVIYQFYKAIVDQTTQNNPTKQRNSIGCFAIANVPLKNGGETNIWIEYDAILENGFYDSGIQKIIIYDEIPDIILDRYNELKQLLEKV